MGHGNGIKVKFRWLIFLRWKVALWKNAYGIILNFSTWKIYWRFCGCFSFCTIN